MSMQQSLIRHENSLKVEIQIRFYTENLMELGVV